MVKNLRTVTFSNIKNEESWFSPFSAEQDSQVDSKLEKIPETIHQVWLYNPNNDKTFVTTHLSFKVTISSKKLLG